ncbi:MAG: 37S ribosomal protein S22 [Phylliscum demangeonii]|nr:MAG: 37S ribosomal protein S22 [Phylliscum demangeonii]
MRTHPLTVAGRFATFPSTLQLPRAAMTEPVAALLAPSSNKHISEVAHRVFGGPGLPFSPATPASKRHLPQSAIKLDAGQRRMGEIEGDVYLAAVMPAVYAAVTSTLVEVRKRLGARWLRDLLQRDGGPRVLDAGAAGAGVLAWREVLRAEWATMAAKTEDDDPADAEDRPRPATPAPPPPFGQSTVVVGSGPLRQRVSQLLDDTTFLPRLPDYVHVAPADDGLEAEPVPAPETAAHAAPGPWQPRLRFDVIIAPHTLYPMREEWQRKQQVDNLWAMLDPDGGVLILLEKGLPLGFEAVAAGRQRLLDRSLSRSLAPSGSGSGSGAARPGGGGGGGGMIIAPCTNHARCPMYPRPMPVEAGGRSRKDFCHFVQRYIRPPYLQRILGAADRNHEDVQFSYVAVRKGRDERDPSGGGAGGSGGGLQQGEGATEAAFVGYPRATSSANLAPALVLGEPTTTTADDDDHHHPDEDADVDHNVDHDEAEDEAENENEDEDIDVDSSAGAQTTTPPPPPPPPPTIINTLSLPRAILPPLKRSGHVILDVCTPAGQLERWTVPRSFGKEAYRDARKSRWGDLWPWGAKIRVARLPRLAGPPRAKTTTTTKTTTKKRKKARGGGDGDGGGDGEPDLFAGLGPDQEDTRVRGPVGNESPIDGRRERARLRARRAVGRGVGAGAGAGAGAGPGAGAGAGAGPKAHRRRSLREKRGGGGGGGGGGGTAGSLAGDDDEL